MRTLMRNCLLPLCLLGTAPTAFSTDNSHTDLPPYQAYLAAKEGTWRSQEVLFSCFKQSFKYVNGFFGRESLYIKEGLDWRSVPTFQARDHGLSMTTEVDLGLEAPQGFSELPMVLDIIGNPLEQVTYKLFRNEVPSRGIYEIEVDLSTMVYRLKNHGKVIVKVRPDLTEYRGLHRLAGVAKFFPAEELPAPSRNDLHGPIVTGMRVQKMRQLNMEIDLRTREALQSYDTSEMYATANPGDIAIKSGCSHAIR